jgi:hypothetical protein
VSLPPGVALILTTLVVVLVPVVASVLLPRTEGATATATFLQHQVGGLANPFDPHASTLIGHTGSARAGLASAVQHPFGLGVGAITLGAKFGGLAIQTEADMSNVAVAFGPLGVVAFLVLSCLALARAYRTAARLRTPLTLATLGILVATTNQWLNGGMYAVAWLPWLVLGWLDRPRPAGPTEGEGP